MDRFEDRLVAAFKKKKLAVMTVVSREDADFEVLGGSRFYGPSGVFDRILRLGKWEVNISVRNARTGASILEHTLTKRITEREIPNYHEIAAEECADVLMQKIVEPKT